MIKSIKPGNGVETGAQLIVQPTAVMRGPSPAVQIRKTSFRVQKQQPDATVTAVKPKSPTTTTSSIVIPVLKQFQLTPCTTNTVTTSSSSQSSSKPVPVKRSISLRTEFERRPVLEAPRRPVVELKPHQQPAQIVVDTKAQPARQPSPMRRHSMLIPQETEQPTLTSVKRPVSSCIEGPCSLENRPPIAKPDETAASNSQKATVNVTSYLNVPIRPTVRSASACRSVTSPVNNETERKSITKVHNHHHHVQPATVVVEASSSPSKEKKAFKPIININSSSPSIKSNIVQTATEAFIPLTNFVLNRLSLERLPSKPFVVKHNQHMPQLQSTVIAKQCLSSQKSSASSSSNVRTAMTKASEHDDPRSVKTRSSTALGTSSSTTTTTSSNEKPGSVVTLINKSAPSVDTAVNSSEADAILETYYFKNASADSLTNETPTGRVNTISPVGVQRVSMDNNNNAKEQSGENRTEKKLASTTELNKISTFVPESNLVQVTWSVSSIRKQFENGKQEALRQKNSVSVSSGSGLASASIDNYHHHHQHQHHLNHVRINTGMASSSSIENNMNSTYGSMSSIASIKITNPNPHHGSINDLTTTTTTSRQPPLRNGPD